MPEPLDRSPADRPHKSTSWLKRFGVAGFLFFFIKGLLWLALPAVLLFFGC